MPLTKTKNNSFKSLKFDEFTKNGKVKNVVRSQLQEYLDRYKPLMLFPYDWLQKEPLFSASGRARDLYQFLWGRKVVSIHKKMFDKKGIPYVICSRKEASEYLNVSEPTTGKCFKELRNIKLIREVNTSGNNMVFVHDVVGNGFGFKRLNGIIKKGKSKTNIKKLSSNQH